MTKEQEEAIERVNKLLELEVTPFNNGKSVLISKTDLETVLNMLKEKDKKIENKDEIIDEMAKKLNQAYFDENKFEIWFEKMMGVQEKMDYGYVVPLIKQYFERKANNETK